MRRHQDREVEMEYDERDRIREKDEMEELRLQVRTLQKLCVFPAFFFFFFCLHIL